MSTEVSERIVGFIPARAESTRFPGKPLADICGKPMIARVYDRALLCELLTDLYIASDSSEILNVAALHGCKGVATATTHACGTDRIAEAAARLALGDTDIVVNIQGDQPLFEPEMLHQVTQPLVDDPSIPMSTLIYKIIRSEEITHPNAVKTVFDHEGFALYFSRSTIPYFRRSAPESAFYKHHGIYAYRNDFLQKFAALGPSFLEKAEGLEQLRALEHGFRLKVVITEYDSIEVDTPEDLKRARETYGRQI